MAEIIVINNFPEANLMETAELTEAVIEGATTLPIFTENNFDDEHAILIGDPGNEGSAIVIPTNVADDSITVPALDNPYPKGTRIYKLRGHKARLYRASNVDGSRPATAGAYSTLVSEVTLNAGGVETELTDPTGGSGYWYLYTFYNDLLGVPEETAKNTLDAVRGGNVGHFVSVDEVLIEAKLENNPYISASTVQEKINFAEGKVKGALVRAGYSFPLTETPAIAKNAALLLAAGYLLTSDPRPEFQGVTDQGKAKIEMGNDLIADILAGKGDLLDSNDASLGGSGMIEGYPNDSTARYDGEYSPIFNIDDTY